MKRSFITFLILGLALGSAATAEAGKEPARVERTVEASYGAYPAPVTGCNSLLGSFACASIRTRDTEAFFTASITDSHGRPVFVEVRSGGARVAVFCGTTTEPVRFKRDSSLEFHVGLNNWLVSADCPANRIKTTGTIRVTLSNLPRQERVVKSSYGAYPAPATGCNTPLGSFACLIVKARSTERFFTASVTDVHGQPVFVEVHSGGEVIARFCGKTAKPIAFKRGTSLQFHLGLNNWWVSLDCPAHRIKTTGTIRVALSDSR